MTDKNEKTFFTGETQDDPATITPAHKAQKMSQAISYEIAQGWKVEYQGPDQVVLVSGKKVNHILHLILTLFTGGFWLLVWLIVILANPSKKLMITVDDYGNFNRLSI